MHEEALVRRVKIVLEGYDNSRPFALYLRDYFRSNPQMGARDRRMTRSWCYNYLRLGRAVNELPFKVRLTIGCFLCSNSRNPWLTHLLSDSPIAGDKIGDELTEKISEVKRYYPSFSTVDLFPMIDHMSEDIPRNEWCISLLRKPRVWIRIRRQGIEAVLEEFKRKSFAFKTTDDPLTLSFLPDVQLDKTDSYQNGLFEIQDINSQRTGKFFKPENGEKWWDICAGSGGKSLLLNEHASDIHIIASDVRDTILKSYAARMRKAGHHNFETQVIDFHPEAKKKSFNMPAFDGVIADVPCSGSGTWARSPEWNQSDIIQKVREEYIPLQESVVAYAIEYLKPGKPLIYITCSVFKEENEDNILKFERVFPLKMDKYEYLKGFASGADTLFAARFIRR